MAKSLIPTNSIGQLLLYKTEDGLNKIEVKLVDETVWLTQMGMAELFQTSKQNISLYLKNIFKNQELMIKSAMYPNYVAELSVRDWHCCNVDFL